MLQANVAQVAVPINEPKGFKAVDTYKIAFSVAGAMGPAVCGP